MPGSCLKSVPRVVSTRSFVRFVGLMPGCPISSSTRPPIGTCRIGHQGTEGCPKRPFPYRSPADCPVCDARFVCLLPFPAVPHRFQAFPGNGQTPTGHRSPRHPFRGAGSGPGVEASPQDHRRGTPEAGSQRSRVGQGAREQTRNSPESVCAALTRRPTPADPSQALSVALRGPR